MLIDFATAVFGALVVAGLLSGAILLGLLAWRAARELGAADSCAPGPLLQRMAHGAAERRRRTGTPIQSDCERSMDHVSAEPACGC